MSAPAAPPAPEMTRDEYRKSLGLSDPALLPADEEQLVTNQGVSPAAPPDDLVRRFACFTFEDGVYEHPQGQHVAYEDYARAAARIQADAARIAELEKLNASQFNMIQARAKEAQDANTRLAYMEKDAQAAFDLSKECRARAVKAGAEVARLTRELDLAASVIAADFDAEAEVARLKGLK